MYDVSDITTISLVITGSNWQSYYNTDYAVRYIPVTYLITGS